MLAMRQGRRTVSLIGSAFMVLVGLVMLFGAIVGVVGERQFMSRAVKVSGTVVQLVSSIDSKNNTSYQPVVEYTTTDNQQYSYTSNVKSNPATHQVGDKVDVYYDPADPSSVVIAGETNSVYLILGGIGFALALIAGLTVTRRLLIGR